MRPYPHTVIICDEVAIVPSLCQIYANLHI